MSNPIWISGYSDDCAGISGIEDSEYDVPRNEYQLLVNRMPVAILKIRFEHQQWVTTLTPLGKNVIVVRKK